MQDDAEPNADSCVKREICLRTTLAHGKGESWFESIINRRRTLRTRLS